MIRRTLKVPGDDLWLIIYSYIMADSPAVHAPLDPKEQPILSRVLELRDQLSLLKQDRSSYIKSQDILPLYDHVIEQVHLLNVLREEHGKPLESNRGLIDPYYVQEYRAADSKSISGYCSGGLFPADISFLPDHWSQQ